MTTTMLLRAHNEWAARPADERMWTIEDLDARARAYHNGAREREDVETDDLRVRADKSGGLLINGYGNSGKLSAHIENWAFKQLCDLIPKANAPAYRSLPADLAADCINHGLNKHLRNRKVHILYSLNADKSRSMRSINSRIYTRIWNSEVTGNLLTAAENGWRVPPARPVPGYDGPTRPATETDCLANRSMHGLSVQPGDEIAPAGLYISDRNMFAFLVNEDRPIQDGAGGALYRGFFVENSELGGLTSFTVTTFLYNAVCGNHIVWGAKGVNQIRVPHVGEANEKAFRELRGVLTAYADGSSDEDEKAIKSRRTIVLGKNRKDVIKRIFAAQINGITKTTLEAAFDLAQDHPEDGNGQCDPHAAWGMAQGLTRFAQMTPYADHRVDIDLAAGRLLQDAPAIAALEV